MKIFGYLFLIFLFPLCCAGQKGFSPKAEDETICYSLAISEYIQAVYKKDKTVFDTLFIGKHEDFPDITFPAVIQNTKIKLLTTEEASAKLNYRASLYYINMIGTITKDKADFAMYTFFVDKSSEKVNYWPKHNCISDFKYNAKKKELSLLKLKFMDVTENPYPKSND